jgi:hypothetical protein
MVVLLQKSKIAGHLHTSKCVGDLHFSYLRPEIAPDYLALIGLQFLDGVPKNDLESPGLMHQI